MLSHVRPACDSQEAPERLQQKAEESRIEQEKTRISNEGHVSPLTVGAVQ